MYKNKTASFFIIMLFTFVPFNLSAKIKTNKSNKKVIQVEKLMELSVKKTNELKNSDQIKSMLLSMTKTIEEGKKVDILYHQMFGKKPILKKVNVINNTLYIDGIKQTTLVSVLQDRIVLKKDKRAATFMFNETSPISLLKEYRKLLTKELKTANSVLSLIVSKAYANGVSSDAVALGLIMILKDTEKRVFTSGKAPASRKPSPYDFNTDSCSGSTANLQKFLNETLSKNKKSVAKWPNDFSFAIQDRTKIPSTTQTYHELAKKWVKELKAKGDTKKITCDFSDPKNVKMNFDKYLTFSSAPGKFSPDGQKEEIDSQSIKGNITANVDWFGLSDVSHYSSSFLEGEAGAFMTTDGKGHWCELDYRNALIKDMGFSLHEICKMAWNSPEEYPEIAVTKPSSAIKDSSSIKTKVTPFKKNNDSEAEAATVD